MKLAGNRKGSSQVLKMTSAYRSLYYLNYELWRRHIRHNQTVRQAVEYCTIYLNPHVGGVTVITHMCENSVYAQCVQRNAA